jgi:hypothetical protein
MPDGSLSLRETRRRIDDLVAELHRESIAIAGAGQGMAGSPGHPYPAVAGPYGTGGFGYGGVSPSDAYQGVSSSAAKVERIKQDLLDMQTELNRKLVQWYGTYEGFRQGQWQIKEVAGASAGLGDGQQIAEEKQTQIVGLMNTINDALHRAQQAIPSDAGHTGRPVRRTLDQLVGQGNGLYRGTAANKYALPFLPQYVVPSLDKERYGKLALQTTTEHPVPLLRRASPDNDETIQDKIIRGLGYLEKQNLRTYEVELPAYYYEMYPKSYAPVGEGELGP